MDGLFTPIRNTSARGAITQVEQAVRPRSQAVIELPSETGQLPELIYWTPILHTDHAALGVDLLPSQEAEASKAVRDFVAEQQHQTANTIPREDAVLRAGLLGAVILAAVIRRHMIRLDGLSDASPEEITALLRPCFRSLIEG